MRGNRLYAVGIGLVALVLPLAVATADPRHEFAAGDPTGSVEGQAWLQPGGGGVGWGSNLQVRPPQSLEPPAPVRDLPLPAPPEGGDAQPPLVEPPDLGPGPHLPDLVPLPAWEIYVDSSNAGASIPDFVVGTAQGEEVFAGGKPAIRFAATIANRGRHSLEVVGVPKRAEEGEGEDPVRVQAFQCVHFAGPRVVGGERVCQSYQPVGSLSYHVHHGHFHIDGFAQYRLLRDVDGRPDTSPGGVVSRSEKVGFCMGDTDWLGSESNPVDTGWYRECRATTPNVPVTARQGISPSWGDTYGSYLPGQHLVIEDLPDGIYWISITVNPPEWRHVVKLHETSLANNTSYRRVRLHANGTRVEVL